MTNPKQQESFRRQLRNTQKILFTFQGVRWLTHKSNTPQGKIANRLSKIGINVIGKYQWYLRGQMHNPGHTYGKQTVRARRQKERIDVTPTQKAATANEGRHYHYKEGAYVKPCKTNKPKSVFSKLKLPN